MNDRIKWILQNIYVSVLIPIDAHVLIPFFLLAAFYLQFHLIFCPVVSMVTLLLWHEKKFAETFVSRWGKHT